ncbi:MAG: hypothetical protein JWO38_2289 [Gemmataceae bacterium]|nr:hypothetical protein [Gemmataceae bacterium]
MSQLIGSSRPEGTPSYPPTETARPGVLVVSSDPARRAELAAVLTTGGAEVWQAESGLEGLSTFLGHTGDLDVILLDADLPDLPGPAFLRRLRTHFPGMPCVFLTGLRQPAGLEAHGIWAVPGSAAPAAVTRAVAEAISFFPRDGT